jgi:hypothetical protein
MAQDQKWLLGHCHFWEKRIYAMNNWTRPNKPELDATKVPTALDIAWSAGIYEGEGTCRLCGHTKRGFMVSIAQKETELLCWIRDWFGGSIHDNCAKTGVHVLDLCGDRARIFMALIYPRLTSRRKIQADATGCLDFLQGRSSEGMSMSELKAVLNSYYGAAFSQTWRGNAEIRKKQQAAHYHEQAANPVEMAKILERNRSFREHMTPEQKEASRKYQHEYYLKKKGNSRLLVMEKTA